jgi:hypothetical protein
MAVVLDTPWTGTSYSPATPLDIATLESAIVTQLAGALGNLIEVAHYPNNPETYRLTHRVGAALVQYTGAKYDPPEEVALVVQQRTLEFVVTVMMRDLGWAYGGPPSGTSPGAYQMLEAVRVALAGYRLAPDLGATKLTPVRERFVKREDGIWHYAIHFTTRTVAVENYLTPAFPLFRTGLAFEENGQTVRVIAPADYVFNGDGVIILPKINISSLTVASPAGAFYSAGADYLLDTVAGVIAWIPTGNIAAGATVSITYSYAEVVEALASGGTAPLNPTN